MHSGLDLEWMQGKLLLKGYMDEANEAWLTFLFYLGGLQYVESITSQLGYSNL